MDTRAWFGRDAPVVLEIGSGSGTSTLAMAKAEPHVDVIAVDVYRRGLAQLLCAIDKVGSDGINIRLILGNAVDVLQHLIAPDSLCGVRVFFPDPWPKARHHKRRLLQPATMALIADRLVPSGVLHAATDHPGYAEHIARPATPNPGWFASTPTPNCCRFRSSDRLPSTRGKPSLGAAQSSSCYGKSTVALKET
ncbi:tRNA (guanine-N(7)-)-methyltransferase [Mycobacterium tuberculosis]|nr:tRNA (guanine-N(7)-)-methyltransferase [Mycobacterium tuberculosis]